METMILHQDENYRTSYSKLKSGIMLYKEYYSKINRRYEEMTRMFWRMM